ncbi:hypothetical protein MaudCBS49596_000743 [Microsporum audouinii]
MAAAHHRHQSSLEGVLDFSLPSSLSPEELALARSTFGQLIDHCEPVQADEPYKKATLVRLMHEQSRNKDAFLHHFFLYLGNECSPPGFSTGLDRFAAFDRSDADQRKAAESAVDRFAGYLFDNFFLPLKASGGHTPQPTPASLTAPVENVAGTASRIATLRRDCLIRDHHRCVATRAFDAAEAVKRYERDGADSRDDEGRPLLDSKDSIEILEVAHILPHSLMSTDGQQQLSESKKSALAILNLFDHGVIHEIEGPDIDRPKNAISLIQNAHWRFGNFDIHFESMDEPQYPPHTYRVNTANTRNPFLKPAWIPVVRTFYLSPNRTVEPPSRRLLDIHRACATILHLSAAGEYITKILEDREDPCVPSDGSAHLGQLVSLKLDGWLTRVAA